MFLMNELEFHYTTSEDMPLLVEMFAKEDVCANLYYGPNSAEETEEEFMPVIEAIGEALIQHHVPESHLFTVRKNGEFIGLGGLFPLELSKANYLIGFTVDSLHWKQGFGTKMVEFLLDFAFDRLKAHKVTGDCLPTNYASQKLFSKFAFQKEGLVRAEYFSKGTYHDNMLFGLLSSEYLDR